MILPVGLKISRDLLIVASQPLPPVSFRVWALTGLPPHSAQLLRRSEGTLNRGPVLELPLVEKGRKTPYLKKIRAVIGAVIAHAVERPPATPQTGVRSPVSPGVDFVLYT